MGFGTSLFLIAVGAILRWAVYVQNSHGFNINRIGLIIFIVGIIGLVVSMIFWSSWGGFGSFRRRTVTHNQPYPDGDGRPGPGRTYNDTRATYVDEREQRY